MVAIPVFSLLLAMVVFYQFEQQLRRAEGAVERTFEVRADLRRVLTLMVNAETGIRGYLLSGHQNFLPALRRRPRGAARRAARSPSACQPGPGLPAGID